MALSGIQIFKMMPKKNCGECGVPTCLAFAMNLAAGKAELDLCPYVSEDAKEKLASASAPPIRTVVIGSGDSAVKTGGETVLYRHEKTFNNPTALGCLISASEDDASVDSKLNAFKTLRYERVGLTLKPDLIAVKDTGDAGALYSNRQEGRGRGCSPDPYERQTGHAQGCPGGSRERTSRSCTARPTAMWMLIPRWPRNSIARLR